MGLMSRSKGKRYERAVATWYKRLGLTARRGQQGASGMEVPDVVVGVTGKGALPWWIECKERKATTWIFSVWRKLLGDCPAHCWPILHVKQTAKPGEKAIAFVVICEERWAKVVAHMPEGEPQVPPVDKG